MRIPKTVALACSALIVASCAGNPSKPQRGSEARQMPTYYMEAPAILLIEADTDRDLVTTRQELDIAAQSLFPRIDTDGSGSLRPLEMTRFATAYFGEETAGLNFMRVDQNANGNVVPAELKATMQALFNRADKNDDGQVSRQELVKVAQRSSQRGGSRDQDRPPPGGGEKGRGKGRR